MDLAASWVVAGTVVVADIAAVDTSLIAVVGAIAAQMVAALAIVAAVAVPTDLTDQVGHPKVVVAGVEIDSLAKAVGYCLVDTVT